MTSCSSDVNEIVATMIERGNLIMRYYQYFGTRARSTATTVITATVVDPSIVLLIDLAACAQPKATGRARHIMLCPDDGNSDMMMM